MNPSFSAFLSETDSRTDLSITDCKLWGYRAYKNGDKSDNKKNVNKRKSQDRNDRMFFSLMRHLMVGMWKINGKPEVRYVDK